jgi:hypothetical protein
MAQNYNIGALGRVLTVNSTANTATYTSALVVGNSSVNVVVNSSSVYVNGSPVGGATNTAAQYTWSNTQTFSNTITFTSTIVGTVNNSLYLGGTIASGYQTTAGLSANVATLTANNANNLGGVAAASYVNTSAAYTISGVHTHSANLVMSTTAGISANGGYGTAGQVLTSNGTTVYWATASGGGTPGGSNTQVQFNNSGAFGGNANFTYTTTSNTLNTGSLSMGIWAACTNYAALRSSAMGVGSSEYAVLCGIASDYNTYIGAHANGNVTIRGGNNATGGQLVVTNTSVTVYGTLNTLGGGGGTALNIFSGGDLTIYSAGNTNASTIYCDNPGEITFSGNTRASGSILAVGDVISNYSDMRLKNVSGPVLGALDKVSKIDTFFYTPNKMALSIGADNEMKTRIGVSAQQMQEILPEVVFDSPLGQGYITVQYERIVPLLIEAIKELKAEVDRLNKEKQE